MADYKIIQDLCESKMFRSKQRLGQIDAKDAADLAFLNFLGLAILSSEFDFAPEAQRYAQQTIMYNNFDNWRFGASDLYVLLHVLMGKNNEEAFSKLRNRNESKIFKDRINPNFIAIKRFLTNIRNNKIDKNFARRFLLKIQYDLSVDNASYRALRYLVADWPNLGNHQKRLVMTRMLQAFRHKARISEMRDLLEALSKSQKMEYKKVNNTETGEKNAPKEAQIPWWVKTGGAAAAAFAGYKAVRRKKK